MFLKFIFSNNQQLIFDKSEVTKELINTYLKCKATVIQAEREWPKKNRINSNSERSVDEDLCNGEQILKS